MADPFQLLQLVSDNDEPLVIRMRHQPERAAAELLASLGAGWTVDRSAPPCVGVCDHEACHVNAATVGDVEQLIVAEIFDGRADTSHVHIAVAARPDTLSTVRALCGAVGSVYVKAGSFAASPWCDQCLDIQDPANRRRTAMSVVETVNCKIDGCNNPAEQRFGKYGGLCLAHRGTAGGSANHSTRRASPLEDGYTARVRALLAPARSLDQAKRKRDAAGTNEQLQTEFAEASRRATAVPNADNLGRLEAATRALRQEAPRAEKARQAYADAERAFKLALAAIAADFRAGA